MQIERKDTRIIVTAELPEGSREFSLRTEEAFRLLAGESFLRQGMIMRRQGDVVELRNASPGVSSERRVLGTTHIDQFLMA